MNVVLAIGSAPLRLALDIVLSEEPGMTMVGMASETAGLLALMGTAQPDLVLVEWELAGCRTASVITVAHTFPRPLRILVLSRDATFRSAALTAGAWAFVVVGDPPEILLATLRQARTMPAGS
jgi:DNA-binding NarL/FixJ family response regulator